MCSERLTITKVTAADAPALRTYYLENEEHLRRFQPRRAEGYHSAKAWQERAQEFERAQRQELALFLVGRLRGESRIATVCSFSNIARGVFQACNVGYSVHKELEGMGIMSEMLGKSIGHVFKDLDLHRVMANYLPENERSERLLRRFGFEREGYARSYLKIAGEWRDHVLTSLINPSH